MFILDAFVCLEIGLQASQQGQALAKISATGFSEVVPCCWVKHIRFCTQRCPAFPVMTRGGSLVASAACPRLDPLPIYELRVCWHEEEAGVSTGTSGTRRGCDIISFGWSVGVCQFSWSRNFGLQEGVHWCQSGRGWERSGNSIKLYIHSKSKAHLKRACPVTSTQNP